MDTLYFTVQNMKVDLKFKLQAHLRYETFSVPKLTKGYPIEENKRLKLRGLVQSYHI